MIQEFDDNEVFSTDYLNIAPKAGDLAAIYEKGGRNLLMARDENDVMTLPEALLWSKYWFDKDDPEADRKAEEAGGRLVYLFTLGGTSYYTFIYLGEEAPDFSFAGMEYLPFSFENRPLPQKVYFGAETAFQLSNWYNDNKRCGRCGGKMTVHPKIRCVRCTSCGYMVFPRVMPAVIIAVIHDDKLLMIRYRGREEDGYAGAALIAGFIEIGESIEDTVRREVMEEAGLKAVNIRYYKSQPWGFASNLMIGCICDIEGSDEIEVHDTQEIAKAVWLTREQLTKPNSTVTLTDEMIAYFKYGEAFREHLVV